MEKKFKSKRHVSSNQNTVRSDTGTSSDLTFVRLDQSRTPELKSKKWTGLNLCAGGFFESQCRSYCVHYLKVMVWTGKAFPNVAGGCRSAAHPGITFKQNRPPRWEAPRKAQCKVNAESWRENFLQGLQCLRMSARSLGQMAALLALKQNLVLLLERFEESFLFYSMSLKTLCPLLAAHFFPLPLPVHYTSTVLWNAPQGQSLQRPAQAF